jgi:uncharacterized surface protein with fasciclin (FAS1) repeats
MGIVPPGRQIAAPLEKGSMYGGIHSSEKPVAVHFLLKRLRNAAWRLENQQFIELKSFRSMPHARSDRRTLALQLHSQLNRSTYFRSLTSRSSFMNQNTNVNQKPSKNIVEMAREIASFSALAAGIKEVGLVDTLAGTGPFTVFAPSDEAFKKLPHGALDALMKDKVKLKAVLSYHVVMGRMLAKDLKAGDLKAVHGSMLHVKVSGAAVEINGARILGADVMATNGVIHIIDAVLLPKNVKLLAEAA